MRIRTPPGLTTMQEFDAIKAKALSSTMWWPVILTVVVIVPLLVFAWWRIRDRQP